MKRVLLAALVSAVAVAPALAQGDSTGVRPWIKTFNGWLGMGLSCSHCSFLSYGTRASRWAFSEPPLVFSVDANGPADRAGLRTGDTLISVDGHELTSREGGERFARIESGQTVTLRYRRDGTESETRVVAGERLPSPELAMQDSMRARERREAWLREQLERESERARQAQQRAMEQSQAALERQREYMERAMEQLQQVEGRLSDSVRAGAVERTRAMLDSAVERWRVAESLYAQVPAPVAPVAPVMPVPPVAAVAPMAPMAPLTYREHRAFGPLRYTGQIGDVVIEARSPYAATATEVSDSEVVVSSRDLSVRIAIRPRQPTPTPRAAPAPKAAPQPRPARTPKPAREQI